MKQAHCKVADVKPVTLLSFNSQRVGSYEAILKRNANTFSLNAIINVRLRCHETIRASDLKIYHKVDPIVFTLRLEIT